MTNAKSDETGERTLFSGAGKLVGLGALLGLCAFGAISAAFRLWPLIVPDNASGAWALVAALSAGITALTGVVIAWVAYRGLHSLRISSAILKLTQVEMVNRAEKEAKLSAIQRLEEIAKEVVPLNTKVLDALALAGIGVFLEPGDVVSFDPDPSDLTRARAWRAALPTEAYNRIVTFLNRMEAWCVYFTSGVAKSEVAFGPIAPLLRSWVGQYYPILLVLRSGVGPSSGKFPNLVQLYVQWTAQMDTQQLGRLFKDIEGQMQQAQARLSQSRLPDVAPKLLE